MVVRMTSPMCKRLRVDESIFDWRISLDDVSSLRLIVESANSVGANVMFKVKRRGNAYYICVDNMDMGNTCVLSARLELDRCEVFSDEIDFDGEDGGFSFCVPCQSVLIPLGDPLISCGNATIEGLGPNATVKLTLQDLDHKSYKSESTISTLVDCSKEGIRDVKFEYHLEIDVAQLREILKKTRLIKAEHFRIRIHVTDISESQRFSQITFSTAGDLLDTNQSFHTQARTTEDGSMILKASLDDEDGVELCSPMSQTPVFDAEFPVAKLESFIKHVPTRIVNASLGQGQPIMFNFPIKGSMDGSSHIRFLVAPCVQD